MLPPRERVWNRLPHIRCDAPCPFRSVFCPHRYLRRLVVGQKRPRAQSTSRLAAQYLLRQRFQVPQNQPAQSMLALTLEPVHCSHGRWTF